MSRDSGRLPLVTVDAGSAVDEVDEVIAGWKTVRPDLRSDPMRVLSRVRRIAQRLDRVSQDAFAAHGLAQHEFDVLAALRRAPGESMTPGRLSEATHVTSGTMTNRLDRLQGRRLVARRADPDDGRQSVVRLTALGRRRVDGAIETLLDAEREVVQGLPGPDVEVTVRVLKSLLAALVS
jgi:DNA-binding MarR family transcriptional regulator